MNVAILVSLLKPYTAGREGMTLIT